MQGNFQGTVCREGCNSSQGTMCETGRDSWTLQEGSGLCGTCEEAADTGQGASAKAPQHDTRLPEPDLEICKLLFAFNKELD